MLTRIHGQAVETALPAYFEPGVWMFFRSPPEWLHPRTDYGPSALPVWRLPSAFGHAPFLAFDPAGRFVEVSGRA